MLRKTTVEQDINHVDESPTERGASSYFALLSLTVGMFALGANEFIIPVFLSDIADNYNISISRASLVSSIFMVTAAVSSPFFSSLAVKWNHKHLLMLLMFFLASASIMTVFSENFSTLLAARILSACCQSTYMGVGAVVATSLFPTSQQGLAISLFYNGIILNNILGIPLITLLGNTTGWKNTFWPIACMALVGLVGIGLTVPNKKNRNNSTNVCAELAIFKSLNVWMALLTAALGCSGMITSYTYYAKMMTKITGYHKTDMTWLTIVFGLGTAAGNYLGGKLADKNHLRAVFMTLLGLAVILAQATISIDYKIPAALTLFFNGLFGFALVAPLLSYTMSKSDVGKTMISSATISAMDIGIAIGIYLGGLAIHENLGLRSPNWVGATLTSIGILLLCISEYHQQYSAISEVKNNTSQSLKKEQNDLNETTDKISLLNNNNKNNIINDEILIKEKKLDGRQSDKSKKNVRLTISSMLFHNSQNNHTNSYSNISQENKLDHIDNTEETLLCH